MTRPATEFAGKVVVITGGASGIGLAIAKAFAAQRSDVLLAGIREGTYCTTIGMDDMARTLHERADRYATGKVPVDVDHFAALRAAK